MNDWKKFTGSKNTNKEFSVPPIPPWRKFDGEVVKERQLSSLALRDNLDQYRGKTFMVEEDVVEVINAALYLRRPLLVTGNPGTGKSSLIYAVAYELGLGNVLRWNITSQSTVKDSLYQYDAIGRLEGRQLDQIKKSQSYSGDSSSSPYDEDDSDIVKFLHLMQLGTALLPTNRPRALLIDEIDKSNIDLPNDLLNIFEEGEFHIPELARLEKRTVEVRAFDSEETFPITNGHVRCYQFPFIVMTSNGERDFPPAFLRRCLQIRMPEPKKSFLTQIIKEHLGESIATESEELIDIFLNKRKTTTLATDQLMNAIFIVSNGNLTAEERHRLLDKLLQDLRVFGTS